MWMRNEKMRRFIGGNRIARALTFGVQNTLQLRLLAGHKKPATVARVRNSHRHAHSLLSTDESFVLHEIAHAQAALNGAFAEFGVYRGASAKLICEVKGDRTLHLFDTFQGLPDPCEADECAVFKAGQFTGTLPSVQHLLRQHSQLRFHPGLFPSTTTGLEDERFSFVHLDVDLKDATRAGLEFFYPRMIPGGVILTHDYSIIDGVREAFTEFLATRPERVIEFPTTQAMIVCQGKKALAA